MLKKKLRGNSKCKRPEALARLRNHRKLGVANAEPARSVCLLCGLKDNGKKLATGEVQK